MPRSDETFAARREHVPGLRVSEHGDGTATITPRAGSRVRADELRAQLDALAARGVRHVVTSAIGRHEIGPWLDAGFAPASELVLLRADVTTARRSRTRNAVRLRAGRQRDWPELAELDRRAFAPQRGLGAGGLMEAMAVTPAARVRVAGTEPALGFAIAGHDGRCGYLQRLAVEPDAAGRGLGGALVRDTLRWLRRRGAHDALVNTETTNARALALYERHGFVRERDMLVVLEHGS